MFGGEVGVFGGEASPLPPPLDTTLTKDTLLWLNLNIKLIIFHLQILMNAPLSYMDVKMSVPILKDHTHVAVGRDML